MGAAAALEAAAEMPPFMRSTMKSFRAHEISNPNREVFSYTLPMFSRSLQPGVSTNRGGVNFQGCEAESYLFDVGYDEHVVDWCRECGWLNTSE